MLLSLQRQHGDQGDSVPIFASDRRLTLKDGLREIVDRSLFGAKSRSRARSLSLEPASTAARACQGALELIQSQEQDLLQAAEFGQTLLTQIHELQSIIADLERRCAPYREQVVKGLEIDRAVLQEEVRDLAVEKQLLQNELNSQNERVVRLREQLFRAQSQAEDSQSELEVLRVSATRRSDAVLTEAHRAICSPTVAESPRLPYVRNLHQPAVGAQDALSPVTGDRWNTICVSVTPPASPSCIVIDGDGDGDGDGEDARVAEMAQKLEELQLQQSQWQIRWLRAQRLFQESTVSLRSQFHELSSSMEAAKAQFQTDTWSLQTAFINAAVAVQRERVLELTNHESASRHLIEDCSKAEFHAICCQAEQAILQISLAITEDELSRTAAALWDCEERFAGQQRMLGQLLATASDEEDAARRLANTAAALRVADEQLTAVTVERDDALRELDGVRELVCQSCVRRVDARWLMDGRTSATSSNGTSNREMQATPPFADSGFSEVVWCSIVRPQASYAPSADSFVATKQQQLNWPQSDRTPRALHHSEMYSPLRAV
eukprot:NODE_693_length_1976_cov_33.594707_g641_i0.p1 GENE.NODE_693_length_1976_cov_33.594707_g641_i0~~NODE_693_length_1976_cov_33.594707_g641_i0.p1  ORF type:complete len:551 (+),score=123.35 NODE_693_length_1976_cov_33.594707_g641_i0:60-1712(+)